MEFSKQKAAIYVIGYLIKELRTQRGHRSGKIPADTQRHTHAHTQTSTPALSIEQEARFTQTTRNRLPVFTLKSFRFIHSPPLYHNMFIQSRLTQA